jgi:hypothetical protein
MEGNQYFTEAYYGKLPEFETVEKALDVMIAKARKEGTTKTNPNKYPENAIIQNTFKKVFGLKKMILYWVPAPVVNAYTISIYSYMMFGESKDFIEKRSDRGFYDTSGRSVLTVYMYTSVLSEPIDMTGKELLAVILHEFGHNFDYSRFHMIEFLTDAILNGSDFLTDVQVHKTIEDMNDIKLDYLDEVKKDAEHLYKNPKERKENEEKYKKALDQYLNTKSYSRIVKMTFKNLVTAIFHLPIQIYHLAGKKSELFADSFATSYGYGQDLMSGLEKLNNPQVPLKTGKGIEIFRDLDNCIEEIFVGINEIHGTHQERCKAQLKKLKADIKNGDYPPELHDELVEEYEKMKERYHSIIFATPDDQYRITKTWRKICAVIFGGAPNIAKFFKANRV